jgi:hypothetical protein
MSIITAAFIAIRANTLAHTHTRAHATTRTRTHTHTHTHSNLPRGGSRRNKLGAQHHHSPRLLGEVVELVLASLWPRTLAVGLDHGLSAPSVARPLCSRLETDNRAGDEGVVGVETINRCAVFSYFHTRVVHTISPHVTDSTTHALTRSVRW